MNLEERQKENDLRQEAKEKKLRRTEIEKTLLEGARHEAKEVVYPGEGRGSRGTTTAAAGGKSDGKTNKLKVAYTKQYIRDKGLFKQ